MAGVAETFCVYHVTAPGMEPGADELPDDFTYPTMDQLSEQVRWLITYIYYNTFTCMYTMRGFKLHRLRCSLSESKPVGVRSPIPSSVAVRDNSKITITALFSKIFIIDTY